MKNELPDHVKDRKWEDSYTKRVVDRMQSLWPVSTGEPGHAMYNAIELLKQYHRDLHIPYEQRDAARSVARIYKKEAEKAREEILKLRRQAASWQPRTVPLEEELRMARGVAAGNNLYGVVRVIDRAIEEIKPFQWTVYS